MTHLDYEETPKRRVPWGWIVGAIVLLLFGTCSFAFVGVFKNIGVVKPINDGFIATVLDSQLPPANAGSYSEASGITDEALEPVNRMISTLGAPDEIGETSCSENSHAGTGQSSGQFVSCTGSVTYSATPATLFTTWKKEGEDWKILTFNINLGDVEAYGQLVAERERAHKYAPAK